MWTVLKFFIEFVTILLLFYVLGFFFFFWLQCIWDLSYPTRGRTCMPLHWQSLNHWSTWGSPRGGVLNEPGLTFINQGLRQA